MAFPTFLYLNASLGGALLQPLLEIQDSLTGQQFAAQDLGNNTYPIASGPTAVAQEGVERECPRHLKPRDQPLTLSSSFRVRQHAHHAARTREDNG